MEEIYDLQQHTHFVVIYMQEGGTYIEICSNLNRSLFNPDDRTHQENNMVYNSQTIDKNTWREVTYDLSPVNSLIEKLRRASEKEESNWDIYDVTNVRTIRKFIKSRVDKLIALSRNNIASPAALHYVFIVPSQWDESIRQDTIRPIFIDSELIASEDHPDRLLFYTDLESIYYNLQKDPITGNTFKDGQKLVFCRFSSVEKKEILVKLDLIQSEKNNIFDFSDSMLFPKVINSTSFSFSEKSIKKSLEEFLKKKLFPPDDVNQEQSSYSRYMKLKCQDYAIIDKIVDDIYSGDLTGMDTYDEDNLQNEHCIPERKRWMILYEDQKEAIRSIRPIDIYTCIGEPLLKAMKGVLSNNLTREYSLFQIDNRYLANIDLDDRILKWLYRILEYTKHVLKCITTVTRIDIPVNSLDLGEIPKGACHGAFEAIKNSNIHSKPRILDAGISVDSSSTFLDAKVNAIVNIDISLKSTTLSLSFLNDDGLVEEKFGHNELTDEKCLPSLDCFYQVSHETTLTLKEGFILFADNHLVDDIKHLNDTEGDRARNTACTLYIEKLLSNNSPCTNGASESTKQKVYIKAFLLVYMIYINEIISRKLLDRLNRGPMNIGYAVSIDKFLLEGVTGAIDVFKNILYASGLVPKDDNSMKLRVIMQGEGMLPAIQKYLNLELPLKSYFVLAQIHEGHIQLTLNQTVTDPDWKGEQESIIVEDEIVPIENIYDSFCLNVWRNLVENNDSIQLCDEHTDGTSLKIKKEFEVIFMQYILENIVKENTSLQFNKKFILKSKSCACEFHLLIDDIIEVSFKPILQDIMYYISTSLIKKGLFGSYKNIHYLFSLVRFNYNSQFQYTFKEILKGESDQFNYEHGIYTHSLIIPALSSLTLQPVLQQQHYAYQSFQRGTLHQVSSENYAFVIVHSSKEKVLLFKNKIADEEEFGFGESNLFPFIKMGDKISSSHSKRIFYLKQNFIEEYFGVISMKLLKYKTLDNLEYNGTSTLENYVTESVSGTEKSFKSSEYKSNEYIPVVTAVRSQGYSSSLLFSLNAVGQSINQSESMETGEPLTLRRF